MNMNDIIQTIAIYAIPVIFAITLHEAAHGYSAKLLGDDTAYQLGRVTLNPIKHIDPVGTLLIPTALYLATAGSFLFGYAKPVPVRFGNLNHPKRDMIWVALAGPGSNFFQAVLWGIAYILLLGNSVQERFFIEMCQAGILVNVVMFAFNLFPLPPLDGGRIMTVLLRWKWAVPFARIEPYGFFVVLALVISGLISQYWMFPLMGASYWLIDIILVPLRMIFY